MYDYDLIPYEAGRRKIFFAQAEFGVVRPCEWMRELMLQTAPGGIDCRDC